ncbi:MAG: hypothetical protein ACRDNB_04145 [Gaiellaceae bacterium]
MPSPVRVPLAEVAELGRLVSRFPPGAVLAMQDSPRRYVGRDAIARFLASPAGGGLDRVALIATRANCEPAIAVYRFEPRDRAFLAHAIFVLIGSGRPADVFGAADASLFPYFGLPATIE